MAKSQLLSQLLSQQESTRAMVSDSRRCPHSTTDTIAGSYDYKKYSDYGHYKREAEAEAEAAPEAAPEAGSYSGYGSYKGAGEGLKSYPSYGSYKGAGAGQKYSNYGEILSNTFLRPPILTPSQEATTTRNTPAMATTSELLSGSRLSSKLGLMLLIKGGGGISRLKLGHNTTARRTALFL